MKKILTLAVICALTSAAFGQDNGGGNRTIQAQSMAITGPTSWTPGTSFQLNTSLTYSGYSSFGQSYWLEVNSALAPFLQISGETYSSQWNDPNQTTPNPSLFNQSSGASAGFMADQRDLGATNASTPGSEIPPGTYALNTLTFDLAAGASALIGQSFTLRTTTVSPRASIVTDASFNDNNIIPPGTIVVTIVPEPSTLALIGLTGAATGFLVFRRRKTSR